MTPPVPRRVFPCGSRWGWKTIVREVAEKHGVHARDIISPQRWKGVVYARFEAAHRLYTETGMSSPQVGSVLGDRDHSTILHAIKRFKALRDSGEMGRHLAAQAAKRNSLTLPPKP